MGLLGPPSNAARRHRAWRRPWHRTPLCELSVWQTALDLRLFRPPRAWQRLGCFRRPRNIGVLDAAWISKSKRPREHKTEARCQNESWHCTSLALGGGTGTRPARRPREEHGSLYLGLGLSPMAMPPGAQCNDGGSLLSRVCLLFWGSTLGMARVCQVRGGAGWQWGIAATWQLLLGSCQGVGRRLCP